MAKVDLIKLAEQSSCFRVKTTPCALQRKLLSEHENPDFNYKIRIMISNFNLINPCVLSPQHYTREGCNCGPKMSIFNHYGKIFMFPRMHQGNRNPILWMISKPSKLQNKSFLFYDDLIFDSTRLMEIDFTSIKGVIMPQGPFPLLYNNSDDDERCIHNCINWAKYVFSEHTQKLREIIRQHKCYSRRQFKIKSWIKN